MASSSFWFLFFVASAFSFFTKSVLGDNDGVVRRGKGRYFNDETFGVVKHAKEGTGVVFDSDLIKFATKSSEFWCPVVHIREKLYIGKDNDRIDVAQKLRGFDEAILSLLPRIEVLEDKVDAYFQPPSPPPSPPSPPPLPSPPPQPSPPSPPPVERYPKVALTSASSNGYTVTASSDAYGGYGFRIWGIYNHKVVTNDGWHTDNSWSSNGLTYNGGRSISGSHEGEWNKIQFPLPFLLKYVIIKSRIDNLPQAPTEWSIIGSNDNSNWTLLKKSYEQVVVSGITVQVNAAASHTYFALVVHKTSTYWCTVSELEYYGYTVSPPPSPPPSLPPPPRNTIITINGKQLYQDDDGWILLVAYNHVATENNALVPATAPQSPTAGYSHIWLTDLGLTADDVDSVRFYCTSSRHNRVAHWSTSQAIAKQSVVYGVLGIFQGYDKWRTGTTKLDGHNASLPDSISDGWGAGTSTILTSCPSKGRGGCTDLLTLPFYYWGGDPKLWDIGGGNVWQWSCDSNASDQPYDTLHQIWFKKTSAQ